jgi:hypothetical protein
MNSGQLKKKDGACVEHHGTLLYMKRHVLALVVQLVIS